MPYSTNYFFIYIFKIDLRNEREREKHNNIREKHLLATLCTFPDQGSHWDNETMLNQMNQGSKLFFIDNINNIPFLLSFKNCLLVLRQKDLYCGFSDNLEKHLPLLNLLRASAIKVLSRMSSSLVLTVPHLQSLFQGTNYNHQLQQNREVGFWTNDGALT